jgi:hypothetical protein
MHDEILEHCRLVCQTVELTVYLIFLCTADSAAGHFHSSCNLVVILNIYGTGGVIPACLPAGRVRFFVAL